MFIVASNVNCFKVDLKVDAHEGKALGACPSNESLVPSDKSLVVFTQGYWLRGLGTACVAGTSPLRVPTRGLVAGVVRFGL